MSAKTATARTASHRITEPAITWHNFDWTADGHTPKIDTRTPADVGWQLLSVRKAPHRRPGRHPVGHPR